MIYNQYLFITIDGRLYAHYRYYTALYFYRTLALQPYFETPGSFINSSKMYFKYLIFISHNRKYSKSQVSNSVNRPRWTINKLKFQLNNNSYVYFALFDPRASYDNGQSREAGYVHEEAWTAAIYIMNFFKIIWSIPSLLK